MHKNTEEGRNKETDREIQRQTDVTVRVADAVILASSDPEARAFEEQSNKKRFYPDGVYCCGDGRALLITISTEGNIHDHNVPLNRHNYINMELPRIPLPAHTHEKYIGFNHKQ